VVQQSKYYCFWWESAVCLLVIFVFSSILAESFAVFWLHASANPKTWKQKAYFVFHFLPTEEQKANIERKIKDDSENKGKINASGWQIQFQCVADERLAGRDFVCACAEGAFNR
jgi:hypothetical protein